MTYHVPVLLSESVAGLDIRPDGVYVDVTFGGGGHSRAILEKMSTGTLIALDQDEDAAKNIIKDPRFRFVQGNFRHLPQYLRYLGFGQVDGILADLGVSSHHFDASERGFTFREEGPLDMRMNTSSPKTAEKVVNEYSEEQLSAILWKYGELTQGRKMASMIVRARIIKPLRTNNDLVAAIAPALPATGNHKFLARLFQALRIEVNHEMLNLERLLEQSTALIRPGGRLVVIAYHSLEDRMVKNFIRNGKIEGSAEKDLYGNVQVPFRALHSKVIVPDEEETSTNNRARSARLRIAERT